MSFHPHHNYCCFCEIEDRYASFPRIIFETIKNTKFVNALGRPKKHAEERQNVESMRFSLQEKNLLVAFAKKYGFSSWKECVKSIALECAIEDSQTTFINK